MTQKETIKRLETKVIRLENENGALEGRISDLKRELARQHQITEACQTENWGRVARS